MDWMVWFYCLSALGFPQSPPSWNPWTCMQVRLRQTQRMLAKMKYCWFNLFFFVANLAKHLQECSWWFRKAMKCGCQSKGKLGRTLWCRFLQATHRRNMNILFFFYMKTMSQIVSVTFSHPPPPQPPNKHFGSRSLGDGSSCRASVNLTERTERPPYPRELITETWRSLQADAWQRLHACNPVS